MGFAEFKKEKMIKILILEYPLLSNTGYWRIYRPLDIMQKMFPGVFTLKFKRKDLTFSDIQEHNIIITRRPSAADGEILLQFLRLCREWNRPVIFDEDDCVLQCPPTHELWATYQDKKVRETYIGSLKCASAAWVSTPAFQQWIDGALVMPNAILPGELPHEPAPDMGLFGWQGKSIQVHDLIYGGWDWYEANKHKVKQWMFFGWKPPLFHHIPDPTKPDVDNTSFVKEETNTARYMESFTKNKINGMWKPLIDCAFNDHKSNINLLGATMAGGYTVTNYAGKPGWEYASKEILPYNEACDLWANAKADILENYNLIKTAQMRAESILNLLPHFRPMVQNLMALASYQPEGELIEQ